jgi:Zn-dependent alcohol dehydrogenase
MIRGLAGEGEEISTRLFQLLTGRMGRRFAFGGVRGEIPLDLFIRSP